MIKRKINRMFVFKVMLEIERYKQANQCEYSTAVNKVLPQYKLKPKELLRFGFIMSKKMEKKAVDFIKLELEGVRS